MLAGAGEAGREPALCAPSWALAPIITRGPSACCCEGLWEGTAKKLRGAAEVGAGAKRLAVWAEAAADSKADLLTFRLIPVGLGWAGWAGAWTRERGDLTSKASSGSCCMERTTCSWG